MLQLAKIYSFGFALCAICELWIAYTDKLKVTIMQIKNTLGIKKVQGQSEAAV